MAGCAGCIYRTIEDPTSAIPSLSGGVALPARDLAMGTFQNETRRPVVEIGDRKGIGFMAVPAIPTLELLPVGIIRFMA